MLSIQIIKPRQVSLNQKNTNKGIIARWRMELSEYRCEIRHIPGIKNALADMLSREYLEGQAPQINALTLMLSVGRTHHME